MLRFAATDDESSRARSLARPCLIVRFLAFFSEARARAAALADGMRARRVSRQAWRCAMYGMDIYARTRANTHFADFKRRSHGASTRAAEPPSIPRILYTRVPRCYERGGRETSGAAAAYKYYSPALLAFLYEKTRELKIPPERQARKSAAGMSKNFSSEMRVTH